ncbi:ABC transporter F family member 4-like [Pistacia vera]|uniref:ABC transporter F family member 4-like n=1 Tax=Pistacia vera TaxID=55513 RepID=UPI0012639FB3|nr:ABC transporter F family member 4-like [Pistacia vera]
MKRKRGHKKGKPKGASATAKKEAISNAVSLNNTEDNSDKVDEYGNDEYESPMEINTPSSTGTDQPLNVANINPDGSVDKTLGKPVGRVKVKLKTPKMLDSSLSDTDKSSSQMGLERQCGIVDRMEDSAMSLAELKMGLLGNTIKKAGSIKIKSSKALGGSSVGNTDNSVATQGESSYQKQHKRPRMDPQYDREELDAALMVIKKVMKMEAAEPFNAPVNPEALGIPDYFDVIDTPMDFGTICTSLESGDKYMNSEDVYKDVQYIWENCNKYNNKGDYILDLMKRVKKNFMKYWTAAGLYSEQPKGNNGVEIIQVEDVAHSSQAKVQVKGSQPKQKSGKRHGRRHKHDCLCAICVLKRRKREREESARIANRQIGVVDVQEESSPVESPGGEDSSSDSGESQDPDADTEVEGKREEMKMESTKPQYSHIDGKHEADEEEEEEDEEDEEEEDGEEEDEDGEENETEIQKKGEGEVSRESIRQSEPGRAEKLGTGVQTHSPGHEEETVAVKQKTDKKSQEREGKAKLYSNFQFESPMLLNLCGILFPNSQKSVWNGPHSLVQRQDSTHNNSIHAAIESLMK